MNHTFLTDFLLLSRPQTWLFIGILLICFSIIHWMQNRKIQFTTRMIAGSVIGLVLGCIIQAVAGFPDEPSSVVWLNEVGSWYGLVGNGFMDLLKMLVVPLVFLSIVRVIMNMQGNNLGKLASRTIGMLLATTLLAALIGITMASIFKVGYGNMVTTQEATIREMSSIVDTLRGLLPSNPVKAMAEANIVGVVIFASFIGLAIRRLDKKHSELIKPFVGWVEAFYKIILSVAMTIIKYMPYAVIALLANTMTSRGIGVLVTLVKFIGVIYLSLFIMFVIHLLIASINGVSPMKYLKNGTEPLVLAFTSRSSLGTLPVLIEALDQKFKIDEGIASFVGSLGCNMGMNGCAGIYPAVVTVMLAQMLGMEMNLGFYISLLIIIAVSSFGIAGLPGTATLVISVVISGMGMGEYFPLVGAVVAIDPILDMGRTCLNVSGSLVSAIAVNKSFEKQNKEVK